MDSVEFVLRLPVAQLAAIGRVAQASASIEAALTEMIGHAVAPGFAARTISEMVSAESFQAKVEKIRLICSTEIRANGRIFAFPASDLPAPLAESLRGIVDELDEVRQVRNDVIHSHWGISADGALCRRRAKSQGGKRYNELVVFEAGFLAESAATIERLSMHVESVRFELSTYWFERTAT